MVQPDGLRLESVTYVVSYSSRLAVAAFVFEIILILPLGANAIYSLSVWWEMAVARQAEQANIEAIREIKRLKSREAQRDATRMVASDKKDSKSSQAIFAESERMLPWPMADEMLAHIVSALSLYALSRRPRNQRPATQTTQPVRAGHIGDRTFRVRPEGSREITLSTNSADGIGRVIPPGGELPAWPLAIAL
jgi:hypothetical protein